MRNKRILPSRGLISSPYFICTIPKAKISTNPTEEIRKYFTELCPWLAMSTDCESSTLYIKEYWIPAVEILTFLIKVDEYLDLWRWLLIVIINCVPRAPGCEVSSPVYLSVYGLNPQNTMHFTPVWSIHFICRIAAMKKPGKMHCFIYIITRGEQVKTRRNHAHWGFWDTV